jgi:hypothetical protein
MDNADPQSTPLIDELVELARSMFPPEILKKPLDEVHAHWLLAFHDRVCSDFGPKAASRACSSLGGVAAIQQLLRAKHARQARQSKRERLMAEIDRMLEDSHELDRVRGAAPRRD